MKTKTIEHLLQLAKDTNNIHTQNIIDILEKEKQSKDQNKDKLQEIRYKTFLETLGKSPMTPFKFVTVIDDSYSITRTGKIIVNDGEKFDELFGRLAEAYLKNKDQHCITIVRAKCK